MNKGFTLIELLAVIVILAIIALIATPIVLNIINESKESSVLRSADFYLDALKNEIVLQNMKEGGSFKPNVCQINNGTISCDGKEINLNVDGEIPNIGSITINNGKVTEATLTFGENTIIMNSKGELVFDDVTLVNYIKKLYKETKTTTVNNIEYSLDETHGLMNDRLGSSEVSKTGGNIRYYGATPNNYIDIGDRDSDGNIIFWRIIGLFKDIEVTDKDGKVVRTEDLVKIIRSDSLTTGDVSGFSWDYTSTKSYDNNWNDSTLQIMLNDEVNGYFGSGTTNYYNYNTPQLTVNFDSAGLSSSAHKKIQRVRWNLGEYSGISLPVSYADLIYGSERAITSSTWSGKIAIMHLSDYGYGVDLNECQNVLGDYDASTCINTNWLYDSIKDQWTLTLVSSSGNHGVFIVYSDGISFSGIARDVFGVRPVLYLKSNVGIVEEKETEEGLKYFVVE